MIIERNKKIALWWLLGPIGSLIILAIVFFVIILILNATNIGMVITPTVSFMRIVLGIWGIISVLFVFIGVPIGVIYLRKKE